MVRHHNAAEMFKALSVPSRMQILTLLRSQGPLPVKTIAEELGMTSPAVSQHLKILRHVGLVRPERQGYWVPYAVDPKALSDCCGMLVHVCACPACHSAPSRDKAENETDALLQRRDELLVELQRIETELKALRGE